MTIQNNRPRQIIRNFSKQNFALKYKFFAFNKLFGQNFRTSGKQNAFFVQSSVGFCSTTSRIWPQTSTLGALTISLRL